MPVYRFFTDEPLKENRELLLSGSEHQHIKKVLRLKGGEEVTVTDGKGHLAHGSIASITKDTSSILIEKVQLKEKPFHLTLVQGLLKPNKLDLLVEKATEMGADEIVFFPADKSLVPSLKEERLDRLKLKANSALKQSGALYFPKIHQISSLDELKIFPQMSFYGDFTEDALSLKDLKPCTQMMWVVGPESGFSSNELTKLKEIGIQPFSLCHNVLRAETAAIAGLSLFAHHLSY